MDIQYAARDRRDDLPPLDINDFGRQGGFGRPRGQPFSSGMSPAGASTPVAISGFSYHHHAPPPLPPPKFVPIDGQPFSEPDHSRRDAEEEDVPAYKRRVDKDEGYGSMFSSASTRSKYSAPVARFGVHHDRFQLRSSADAYDNSLLKKLDVRRTIDNRSPPRTGRGLSSSNRELPQPGSRVSLLQPLSLPTRTKQPAIHDPSSRLAEHGAPPMASPLSTPFGMSFHSSRETNDPDEAGPRRFRRTGSILSTTDEAPASSPGSCMDIDEPDFSAEEPTRLRDFHIDSALARTSDHHQPTGQKRRASSPLCEPSPASHNVLPPNELFKRRDCPPRVLPTASRLTAIPQGSECHMHPATTRSPYPSSLSLIASSISSLNSTTSYGDRRSPSALSPGGMSPTDTSSCASPFATTISLTASPGSVGTTTPHLRTISMEQPQSLVSPRKGAAEMAKPGMAKTHDYFMCECCPKKPKRFETAEELSTHEAEKQYECSFCGNRFKNKNEMERHQNSLHVRRHSWSCSALSGCERAFHESTATPGEADTCGYCGDDFTRSGHMVDPTTRAVSEHDWDERIRHLQEVHKFQECNSSKKFYRADHFRQHLKHSHAGTSGKWTNMLENACMLEEDPPLPKR